MSYASARTGACRGEFGDWDGDGIRDMGVLLSGPQITLDPSHGDLAKGDVKITATGHTSPGVSVIYEPIYIDLQSMYNKKEWHKPGTTPDDRYWHYDCMGSEGIKDAENKKNMYQFVIEECDDWVEVKDFPEKANGFIYEVYWKTAHCSNPRYQQLHPCYDLDTPVETYMECKNRTFIEGCKFISGEEKSMHDSCTCTTTNKLHATSTQYDMHADRARQAKMNFAEVVPGTQIKIKTDIMLMKYHYTAMWASLGRIKIIPVLMSDKKVALAHFKKLIDEQEPTEYIEEGVVNGTGAFYEFNEKDIIRMQGADLRQAVDALNSAIDLAIATGAGDAATLNALRTRLNTEILEGEGDFGQLRAKLKTIKDECVTAGALKLTKLERDRGVVWDKPGNPKA